MGQPSQPIPHPPHPTITLKHEEEVSRLPFQQNKSSGVQQEEGHVVVVHVLGEHCQYYLLHHYQNTSI